MKWSIQQLRKISNFPFSFSNIIDYSQYISDIEDILDIKPVEVSGQIFQIDEQTYRICYHIKAELILQCSLTLEPLPYIIENQYDEVYGKEDRDAENYYVIENNTLDLIKIVWTNILIEKPINATLPNAYEILKERGIVLDDTITLDEDEEILSYSDGIENEEK